jgi:MFS family permease
MSHALPRLWRNRDFVILWSGQLVSTLGTNVSSLALPLLVLALTRSPAQAGLATALHLLPYALFALPAGALIDRWNRKAIMIACDSARWLALGSIPLAFALGHLALAQIFLAATLEGSANVFFELAEVSALPAIVPNQIDRAWALNETTDATATLAGPTLAGLIIGLARTVATGAVLAYLADSASYLVSVLTLSSIRVPFQRQRPRIQTGRSGLWHEIGLGLRVLFQDGRLRLLMILTSGVNFLQGPLTLALIVLMQETLHQSVETLGIIIGLSGAGSMLGAALAPGLIRRLPIRHIVLGSLIVWALAALVLATATASPAVLLGKALTSFIWPAYAVTVVSYRLSLVPDSLQGRINSAFRLFSYTAEPLGSALGGIVLAAAGARAVLWIMTIGLAILLASSARQIYHLR